MTKWYSGRTILAASILVGSLGHSSLLSAQVSDEQAETADSTIIYPATFFLQYNPVSVNDMIDRIPGISLQGGGGGRGLGTGGDLLINGQRVAGKDNSPRDQLRRIAAKEVERIEIIRGNSTELDVRSSGEIVNVVLKEGSGGSSVSAELNSDFHHDGTVDPGGSVAVSGRRGELNYLFNVQADPRYNNNLRNETAYYPDNSIKDTTREESIRDETSYQLSMNMGYQFTDDRIQLNGLFGTSDYPTRINRAISDFSSGVPAQRGELENRDSANENWEVGGEYEHTFADSSRFLMLFVTNDQERANIRERFSVGEATEKNLFIDSRSRTRERIVQGSYNWQLADSQGMQLGLERAHTILDSSLLVGSAGGSSAPSPAYGDLPPVLGSSNPGSTVQEMRYEGFAVHNWSFNDRMSLETSMVYESSEISQSGDIDQSRDFAFLKPKLDYRFDITPSLQLRASVAREVSQLSFGNFTASVNNSDNDKTANGGNPDLVPEKEYRYELNLEYRLPDDNGVLSSRFFYREIEDVIGRVNVTPEGGSPLSAAGNIGDGIRYGVYLDASTRLGFLGLPDAMLTTGLYVFDSKITDPFLGTDRRFNGRGRTQIGFRHDIPEFALNYGFNFNQDFNGGESNIDVDTIEKYENGPNLSLFISKVAFDDVTFRLESMNTLNSEFCRDRLRYSGLTSNGQLSEIEDSCASNGHKLALKIRTTF